ncbi:MAG: DUF192 domain-containing protein [Synechococcaceae cyanobacterium]|nr:DUF192 domain-containing protein [Synechococcaceae cyanobacterium]
MAGTPGNRAQRSEAGAVLGALLLLAAMVAPRAQARPASGPPMLLPVTARWCLGEAATAPCIGLEVPANEREFSWGLQLRPRLPELRGMWFRFEPAQVARFWMHRTPEPLDMVFVRNGRVIAIEAAIPCMRLPCRSYGPDEPVDGVVELAAGETARLGIRVGEAALIRPLTAPER